MYKYCTNINQSSVTSSSNITSNESSHQDPSICRRCYVSVAVLNNLIYAMGGYDGYHRQKTAERYDYKTNQWSLIAPMNVQRSDASATTLNDKIYITGGFDGHDCLNTAEVYDPNTNQWTMITAMRSRRSGVSCISYHGYVYVIGIKTCTYYIRNSVSTLIELYA